MREEQAKGLDVRPYKRKSVFSDSTGDNCI
jgi:hypothetical protein